MQLEGGPVLAKCFDVATNPTSEKCFDIDTDLTSEQRFGIEINPNQTHVDNKTYRALISRQTRHVEKVATCFDIETRALLARLNPRP